MGHTKVKIYATQRPSRPQRACKLGLRRILLKIRRGLILRILTSILLISVPIYYPNYELFELNQRTNSYLITPRSIACIVSTTVPFTISKKGSLLNTENPCRGKISKTKCFREKSSYEWSGEDWESLNFVGCKQISRRGFRLLRPITRPFWLRKACQNWSPKRFFLIDTAKKR